MPFEVLGETHVKHVARVRPGGPVSKRFRENIRLLLFSGAVDEFQASTCGVGIVHTLLLRFAALSLKSANFFMKRRTLLFHTGIPLYHLRCCINQEDAAAKAAGIGALGSILDRSEHLLALISEDYFDRYFSCTHA